MLESFPIIFSCFIFDSRILRSFFDYSSIFILLLKKEHLHHFILFYSIFILIKQCCPVSVIPFILSQTVSVFTGLRIYLAGPIRPAAAFFGNACQIQACGEEEFVCFAA